MLEKFKKILLNPWTIAILSPIITTAIVAIVKGIDFVDAIKYVVNIIKIILDYKISIKMIALIIILLYIVLRIYIKVLEIKEEQNPKWINYTKDTYKGWYFKWEYSKYYDTYSIKNLRPICECGCGLSNKRRHHNIYYSNGVLVCPKCDRSYDYIGEDVIKDFKTILYHNIETDNYNTAYDVSH